MAYRKVQPCIEAGLRTGRGTSSYSYHGTEVANKTIHAHATAIFYSECA